MHKYIKTYLCYKKYQPALCSPICGTPSPDEHSSQAPTLPPSPSPLHAQRSVCSLLWPYFARTCVGKGRHILSSFHTFALICDWRYLRSYSWQHLHLTFMLVQLWDSNQSRRKLYLKLLLQFQISES